MIKEDNHFAISNQIGNTLSIFVDDKDDNNYQNDIISFIDQLFIIH